MSDSEIVPDWVTLTADEAVVWRGRPTLRSIAGPLLVGVLIGSSAVVAAALTTGIVQLLAGGIWLVAMLSLLAFATVYRSTHYVLTTEEIYRKAGIFSQSVVNIRLNRIQNTAYSQSIVQRLLGCGDVHIQTAGSDGTELLLTGIRDPGTVNRHLTEHLAAMSEQTTTSQQHFRLD